MQATGFRLKMAGQVTLGSLENLASPHSFEGQHLGWRVPRPTRLQVIVWGGIVLLAILVSLSNYQTYQLGVHFDDSRYVVLARSLVSSPTYGMVNVPGEPEQAKYPFGYPLLLTPFLLLFPNNLGVLKVSSLIATILIIVILFWGWKWFFPNKSYWWGLAVTGLYGFHPLTIDHTRRVMSEPVFTLFCLLAFLLAEQYVQGFRPRWWSLAMSASLLFTVFTRSIGVVAAVLVLVYLLLRVGGAFWREIAAIAVLTACLIGLIVILTPVQIQDLLPVEYLKDENGRFILAFIHNHQESIQQTPLPTPSINPPPSSTLAEYFRPSASLETLFFFGIKQHFGSDLRVVAFPIGGGTREREVARELGLPILPALIGYSISALILYGFYRLLRDNWSSLFVLFPVVYFVTIFFWTWNDIRLLYPISAQIVLALVTSLQGILTWATRIFQKNSLYNPQNSILGAVVILLMAGSIYKSTLIDDSRLHAGDIYNRTAWIATHSNPTDILMTQAPETDYLYSGIKTLDYPSLDTTDQLNDYLQSHKVRFILAAPAIEWQLHYHPKYNTEMEQYFPILDALSAKDVIRLVYSSPPDGIIVYRVQP